MAAEQIIQVICSSLYVSPSLSTYISMADNLTSATHFGINRDRAVALRAAHMFTLDSRLNGEAGAVQSETEGRLSVSYAINSGSNDELDQTHYGKQLKGLIKSIPSARVISGGCHAFL